MPTYSAVEVLVKDFGSVKVTATSDDGLGSMQVLAAGDRYPVLADGKEHTVLLGDLSGENSIYVIADKPVTLQKVVWSKDLTPDATVTALAKPAVTVEPAKLDEGTAQDVVISWGAVENAAEYELEFNGAKQTLTETSYTIAAADVAALAVGEYPISVIAKPVATSSKYVASEAGEGKLTIKKVETGGTEVTLTWDFSSAAWQAALEAAAASAKGTNQANWTVTLDGLTYTSGTKNGKWDASGFIQPNGGGSTTERVFSFTAPADGVLKVTAATASAGNAREYVVSDASGVDQTKSVDSQETVEFNVNPVSASMNLSSSTRKQVPPPRKITFGTSPLLNGRANFLPWAILEWILLPPGISLLTVSPSTPCRRTAGTLPTSRRAAAAAPPTVCSRSPSARQENCPSRYPTPALPPIWPVSLPWLLVMPPP